MASLLIVRAGADIVAQCDEHCYNATRPKCECKACGGANHGIGLEQAAVNTRILVAEWDARDDAYVCEVDDAVQNIPLFPLPLDPQES